MTETPYEFAERLAMEAGAILMDFFAGLDPAKTRFKGEIDLVTQADLESERHIVTQIRKSFPGHTINAEEETREEMGEYHWIVDPLDGTTNFAHSLPIFAVSIAFLHKGQATAAVIHAPYLKETFKAERGKGVEIRWNLSFFER